MNSGQSVIKKVLERHRACPEAKADETRRNHDSNADKAPARYGSGAVASAQTRSGAAEKSGLVAQAGQTAKPLKPASDVQGAQKKAAMQGRRVRKVVPSQPHSYRISAAQLSNDIVTGVPVSVLHDALPKRFRMLKERMAARKSAHPGHRGPGAADEFVFS